MVIQIRRDQIQIFLAKLTAPAESVCRASVRLLPPAPPALDCPAVERNRKCSTTLRASGGEIKIPSPRETAASTWLARSITASGVSRLPAPAESIAGPPGSPSLATSPAPQKTGTQPPSELFLPKYAAGRESRHLPGRPSRCARLQNSADQCAAAPRCATIPARPSRCRSRTTSRQNLLMASVL